MMNREPRTDSREPLLPQAVRSPFIMPPYFLSALSGLWRRLVRGRWRTWERSDWVDFVGQDWLGSIMETEVTDHFHAKQGRSTGRWVLNAGDRRLSVYLKRHYRLSWWQHMLASLWPGRGWSPAVQEWRNLEWARGEGLPVPAPVAVGEKIGPWCRLQSFLAVEELIGMLPLHKAIPLAAARLDKPRFRAWKRSLIAEMVRLACALHGRRHFHKDFYLCHFYVPREDTSWLPEFRGRLHLIDLHRLTHHPWTAWLWQAKDLGQLLYSSDIVGVDVRDRLHFWRLYRAGGQHGTSRSGLSVRLLKRCILFKRRSYQRHNARKKAAAA